ncbi:MAG TPA: hypothetical protein VGD78_18370 [Chthoniobacterales bacterium]
MKQLFCGFAYLLLAGCAGFYSNRVDHRNFAIDTYYARPNEVRLAEARAGAYWARNASRFQPGSTAWLAVDASFIFPSEVQDLWPKLINSETTASVFGHGTQDFSISDVELHGVVIIDPKSGRVASDEGYIAADLPPPGSTARFGSYLARFIGTGR